jgi:hypothetical protein
MQPLPSTDLRTNQGTWIVPTHAIPVVTALMLDSLPAELYDPQFRGQELWTTYFDDRAYTLRKARVPKERYLTLRLRCYELASGPSTYALSAKTDTEKWRAEVTDGPADAILEGTLPIESQLPPHLQARLVELDAGPLVPVASVQCHRFAVEDDNDRLTLDLHVHTDRHASLAYGVLEYKSASPDVIQPKIDALRLAPLKLSKFLWATKV